MLLWLLLLGSTAIESYRLVLTFQTPELAKRDYGFQVLKQYGRRQVIESDTEDFDIEGLLFVERDLPLKSSALPWYLSQMPPHNIDMATVWPKIRPVREIVVAVMDNGIAAEMRTAFKHLLDGYDFIQNASQAGDGDGRDPDPTDPHRFYCDDDANQRTHGTKVASVLAASHDGGYVYGVAPDAYVLPVRVMSECGGAWTSDLADGIVWAAGGTINDVATNANPAQIISISMGGNGPCPDHLQSAITQAHSLNTMVVVSAGNDAKRDLTTAIIANCNHVVTVGASGADGSETYYSNRGGAVLMPGGDNENYITVYTVDEENYPSLMGAIGTSYAAPYFAGVMALRLSEVMTIGDPVAFALEEYRTGFGWKLQCPRGTYGRFTGSTLECFPCPVGHYCTGVVKTCQC